MHIIYIFYGKKLNTFKLFLNILAYMKDWIIEHSLYKFNYYYNLKKVIYLNNRNIHFKRFFSALCLLFKTLRLELSELRI